MPMLDIGLQVDISVHEWHLAIVCSRISSSCMQKCKHVTLAINTVKNIFPLHTAKKQDYRNAIASSPPGEQIFYFILKK